MSLQSLDFTAPLVCLEAGWLRVPRAGVSQHCQNEGKALWKVEHLWPVGLEFIYLLPTPPKLSLVAEQRQCKLSPYLPCWIFSHFINVPMSWWFYCMDVWHESLQSSQKVTSLEVFFHTAYGAGIYSELADILLHNAEIYSKDVQRLLMLCSICFSLFTFHSFQMLLCFMIEPENMTPFCGVYV